MKKINGLQKKDFGVWWNLKHGLNLIGDLEK